MRLNFIKVNPVENMTIFIMDQIPRKNHKLIANKLMDYNNLHGEQVGFIERASQGDLLRLQMMGGEFCGNASRSLAALMVHNDYPQIKKKKESYQVDLEVSGIEKSVSCQVERIGENKYLSKIEMPPPISIDEDSLEFKGETIDFTRVDFEGISHFIVDRGKIDDKDMFYKSIKESLKTTDYEAFGIMYYDFEENLMEPLVYVKSTDSLFWERSCASGTCALGAFIAYTEKKSIGKDIRQPGGSLRVDVEYRDGKILNIFLDGEVEIVAQGILYV